MVHGHRELDIRQPLRFPRETKYFLHFLDEEIEAKGEGSKALQEVKSQEF